MTVKEQLRSSAEGLLQHLDPSIPWNQRVTADEGVCPWKTGTTVFDEPDFALQAAQLCKFHYRWAIGEMGPAFDAVPGTPEDEDGDENSITIEVWFGEADMLTQNSWWNSNRPTVDEVVQLMLDAMDVYIGQLANIRSMLA